MAVLFKCTDVVKGYVPSDMKKAYCAIAEEAGCDASDLVRDHVCMTVHGVTFGEYEANHRRAVLGAQDKTPAQKRAAK